MITPSGPGAVAGKPTAPKAEIERSQASVSRPTAACKWQRFLIAVLRGPRTSRELEREPTFDHCPHSTAAEIRKKGVALRTEMITIAGFAGQTARVARYSIAPDGVDFARRLLEGSQ